MDENIDTVTVKTFLTVVGIRKSKDMYYNIKIFPHIFSFFSFITLLFYMHIVLSPEVYDP